MVLLKELVYVVRNFVPVTQKVLGFPQPEFKLNHYCYSKQAENVEFEEEFLSASNEFHSFYLDVDVLAENGAELAGQMVLPPLVAFALYHWFSREFLITCLCFVRCY